MIVASTQPWQRSSGMIRQYLIRSYVVVKDPPHRQRLAAAVWGNGHTKIRHLQTDEGSKPTTTTTTTTNHDDNNAIAGTGDTTAIPVPPGTTPLTPPETVHPTVGTATRKTKPAFPWRHSNHLPNRCIFGSAEFQEAPPMFALDQWGQRTVAVTFLHEDFFTGLFRMNAYKQQLADSAAYAFVQAVSGILSNTYAIPQNELLVAGNTNSRGGDENDDEDSDEDEEYTDDEERITIRFHSEGETEKEETPNETEAVHTTKDTATTPAAEVETKEETSQPNAEMKESVIVPEESSETMAKPEGEQQTPIDSANSSTTSSSSETSSAAATEPTFSAEPTDKNSDAATTPPETVAKAESEPQIPVDTTTTNGSDTSSTTTATEPSTSTESTDKNNDTTSTPPPATKVDDTLVNEMMHPSLRKLFSAAHEFGRHELTVRLETEAISAAFHSLSCLPFLSRRNATSQRLKKFRTAIRDPRLYYQTLTEELQRSGGTVETTIELQVVIRCKERFQVRDRMHDNIVLQGTEDYSLQDVVHLVRLETTVTHNISNDTVTADLEDWKIVDIDDLVDHKTWYHA